MKLLLFLGSGVSIPSRMPSVQDLDNALFHCEWSRQGNGTFSPKRADSAFEGGIRAERVQGFLKLLKTEVADYFAAKAEPAPSYEDLYYICCQIRDEVRNELLNPVAAAFVNVIGQKIGHLVTQLGPLEGKVGLAELAEESLRLIDSVVYCNLPSERQPVGLHLVSELATHPHFSRLDICTLNHDLLVEAVLNSHGVLFKNGFETWDGDYQWLDTSALDDDTARVRLIKLHGSIDWWLLGDNSDVTFPSKLGRFSPQKHLYDCRDANSKIWLPVFDRPQLLCGTYNKLTEYLSGAYAEMRLRFMNGLKHCDLVVMSGYGWNDRGINSIFMRWLGEAASNRIILLHREPDQIRNRSRSSMWHRYDGLVERGQLVLIQKWFEEVSIDQLLQAVEDTKGLPTIPEKRVFTFDEQFPDNRDEPQ